MKIVLFDDYVPGVLNGDNVVDLTAVLGRDIMDVPGPYRMTVLVANFEEYRGKIAEAATRQGKPLASVTLKSPVPKPGKMLFGVGNYNEGLEGIDFPLDLFMKSPSSIIGPGDDVVLPPSDAQLFFHEAELGFVIGKGGRNISRADAMDHIFGYVAINDVSSGGLPGVIGGVRSKSFDTFGIVGPHIVTKDEIPDPHKLSVKLWVDDVLRQDYCTDDMEHPIPEIIEFASSIMTLEPGDIIACGTNHHGIGPIQDGEVMTLEVEKVGRISNKVTDKLKRKWPVGPDHQMEEGVKQLKLTGVAPPSFFSVKRIA